MILLGTRSISSTLPSRTTVICIGGKVGYVGGAVIDPLRWASYNLGSMGRAPNSGAPQRVSAHVVPKAPVAFSEGLNRPSFGEDDEKTTIESGWEEEGSTTVEQ